MILTFAHLASDEYSFYHEAFKKAFRFQSSLGVRHILLRDKVAHISKWNHSGRMTHLWYSNSTFQFTNAPLFKLIHFKEKVNATAHDEAYKLISSKNSVYKVALKKLYDKVDQIRGLLAIRPPNE
jgi:hypothetical protein